MDIFRTDLICKYWALHCSWDDKAVHCSDAGPDCKSHVCNHAAPTLCWVVQFSWTLNYTLNYMDTGLHCRSHVCNHAAPTLRWGTELRLGNTPFNVQFCWTLICFAPLVVVQIANCIVDSVGTQKCSGFDCIYAVVIGGGWAIRRLQIGTKWEPAPLPFWIQMKVEPFP